MGAKATMFFAIDLFQVVFGKDFIDIPQGANGHNILGFHKGHSDLCLYEQSISQFFGDTPVFSIAGTKKTG
jgi:hypothetical protein